MIDIVYILGSGSKWQDNEIRYSLRSVQKHLRMWNNVYVVGRLPEFLTGVIHIQKEDDGNSKEHNICRKIATACKDSRISNRFLMFNDDHFLLTPHVASHFPYYHDGDLQGLYNRSDRTKPYGIAIGNTIQHLGGCQKRNYDVHCPIIYNKRDFLQHLSEPNWNDLAGYLIKSIYANKCGVNPEHIQDIKIDGHYDSRYYEGWIHGRPWFSLGDRIDFEAMGTLMEKLYPIKSQFEI
jgi:hypothetical protein